MLYLDGASVGSFTVHGGSKSPGYTVGVGTHLAGAKWEITEWEYWVDWT